MKKFYVKSLLASLVLVVLALTVTAASAEGLKVVVPDDILPLLIGAQHETIAEALAEDMLGERAKEQLTVYEKATDVIMALLIGEVQAVIMDMAPAVRFLRVNPGQLVILPQALTTEKYAIAFAKDNTKLCEDVNKALSEIKTDGTLGAIFAKYEDGEYYTPAKEINLNVGAAGGKLRVGTETGFPPYDIKDGDGFTGIDIEMCAAIAKKLDKELVVERMAFAALPTAVNSGLYDMLCSGITVTEQRKESMLFSEPYADAGQVIVVRAEDYAGELPGEFPAVAAPGELVSILQLASEKIGVQSGAAIQGLVEQLFANEAKDNILAYEDFMDAIQALKDNELRAVVIGDIAAQPLVRDPDSNLTILPEALLTSEVAIAVKKGNRALKDELNAAMTEMIADGTIEAIIEKYFNDPQSVKPEDIDLNLKADKKIVMGTSSDFMPFEFKVGSGLVGIDIELCAEIAKRLGYALSIVDMTFSDLGAALDSGKIDFICGGYVISEERKKSADFAAPYMHTKQIALVRADDVKK